MENTYANVLGGCLNPDCFDACSHFRPVIDDDMVRNTCENCCCNAGRHLVTGILVGGKFLEQPASSKRPTVVKQLTFAQLYTKDKCVGTEDLSSLSTDSDLTEMQVGPMPSKDGLGYSTPSMRRYYEAFHASTPTDQRSCMCDRLLTADPIRPFSWAPRDRKDSASKKIEVLHLNLR